MLSANRLSPPVLHLSDSTIGAQTGEAQIGQERASQQSIGPSDAEPLPARELYAKRDVNGASLDQLMGALSAAIVHDPCISGDHVLMALAEAAVLERELSSTAPRRWRVQQALDVLLKMGPHVTTAVTAVLEHPLARAQITCLFSD